MMKNNILLILIILILSNCVDKKSDVTPEIKAPIIYGYYLLDINGSSIAIIGTPQIKRGLESNSSNTSSVFFAFYPNPVNDFVQIYTKSLTADGPKKYWIKPARLDNSIDDSHLNFNLENTVIEDEIILENEFTSQNATLDLSSLKKGYYRMYMKIGQDTLYDNLVLTHENLNYPHNKTE